MDFIDFESYYIYIYTYTHTHIYIYYNSCVEEPWYQIEYSQLLQIKDMTVCHRGVRGQNKLSKFLWNNMLNAYTAGFSLKPRDAEIRCKQGPCHKVLQNQACHERIQSIRQHTCFLYTLWTSNPLLRSVNQACQQLLDSQKQGHVESAENTARTGLSPIPLPTERWGFHPQVPAPSWTLRKQDWRLRRFIEKDRFR